MVQSIKLSVFILKCVFPRLLKYKARARERKAYLYDVRVTYLYKRTLSIRDMFHKIYNEKTETKEKIVMNEATDNDVREVMLMKGVKSVINESNERKEAGELKKAYDRVEGIIERDEGRGMRIGNRDKGRMRNEAYGMRNKN